MASYPTTLREYISERCNPTDTVVITCSACGFDFETEVNVYDFLDFCSDFILDDPAWLDDFLPLHVSLGDLTSAM